MSDSKPNCRKISPGMMFQVQSSSSEEPTRKRTAPSSRSRWTARRSPLLPTWGWNWSTRDWRLIKQVARVGKLAKYYNFCIQELWLISSRTRTVTTHWSSRTGRGRGLIKWVIYQNKTSIFRYLGTLAKFAPFCSRPEAAPIISRGCSDDLVYVSYQHKDDALRALWGVAEDEDFPELQVAPDCRNWRKTFFSQDLIVILKSSDFERSVSTF